MLNSSNFIVIDFETVGLTEEQAKNPYECIPASIAAKAFHARTLEPFVGGEFNSLIHVDPSLEIPKSCLDYIHLKREQLTEAPNLKQVWDQFQDFVEKYNYKKNDWTAPIMSGQNIINYDSVIVNRINEKYGKKGKDTLLFSRMRMLDLMNFTFSWFENCTDPKNNKLKTILEHCNIPYNNDELHSALGDVRYTGVVLMKFLRLHRYLAKKINWANNEKKN